MRNGGKCYRAQEAKQNLTKSARKELKKKERKEQRQREQEGDDMEQSVAEGTQSHLLWGYKGCSGMFGILPYLSPHWVCPIPVAHTLLYGILANIWENLLGSKRFVPHKNVNKYKYVHGLDSATIDLIQGRAETIVTTNRQTCAYLDIVEFRDHYKMHHWLSWADWASQLILHGIVLFGDHEFDALVRRVHAAIVWFLYPTEATGQLYWDEFEWAYQSILEWARYVERNMLSRRHLTYNLHVFLCHIRTQVQLRGHPAVDKEFWVERMIKAAKFFVRGRGTREPEAVILHAYLVTMAMRRFKSYYGLQTVEELVPYYLMQNDYGRDANDGAKKGDDHEDMCYKVLPGWKGMGLEHRGTGYGVLANATTSHAFTTKGYSQESLESLILAFFQHGILRRKPQQHTSAQPGHSHVLGPSSSRRVAAQQQRAQQSVATSSTAANLDVGSQGTGNPDVEEPGDDSDDQVDERGTQVVVPRGLQDAWASWPDRWTNMVIYSRMQSDMFDVIHSAHYTVPRSTESFWVLARVATHVQTNRRPGGRATQRRVQTKLVVGKVHYFIKVGLPDPDNVLGSVDNQPVAPLRLAVIEPRRTKRWHEYAAAHQPQGYNGGFRRKYWMAHTRDRVQTLGRARLMEQRRVPSTREGDSTGDENMLCAIAMDDIQFMLVRCKLAAKVQALSQDEAAARYLQQKRKNSRKKVYKVDFDQDWELFSSFSNLSLNTSFY